MPRLFLLEDDPAVTRIVRAAAQRSGFEFESAERVEGVLASIGRFHPDTVLLDVELPDGDGFEVCERIRGDAALSGTSVIFLTTKGDVQSRLKGFAVGGQDYVAKPFAVEELMARIRAHSDLKVRLDAGKQRVDELALRERLREDMVDMVVHDLRAPLSVIRASLDLMRESGLVEESEHAQLLAMSTHAAEFSLCMINDLLDLRSGKVRVEPRPVDLDQLAERVRGLVSLECARRGLRYSAEVRSEGEITTDPTLLFRILLNLLSNSVKFSPSGGLVTLRLSSSGGRLRCEVIDQGPGVPDEMKRRVFEKFFRVDSPETSRTPGSGIGLAFCKLACDLLHGSIRVEDAPEKGSRFVVEIPSGASSDLLDAGALREYREECRSRLAGARRLLQDQGGLSSAQSLGELRRLAHQLAGSAGTYGFPKASSEAARLQAWVLDGLAGRVPADREFRERALASLDVLWSELGLTGS